MSNKVSKDVAVQVRNQVFAGGIIFPVGKYSNPHPALVALAEELIGKSDATVIFTRNDRPINHVEAKQVDVNLNQANIDDKSDEGRVFTFLDADKFDKLSATEQTNYIEEINGVPEGLTDEEAEAYDKQLFVAITSYQENAKKKSKELIEGILADYEQ